MIRILDFLVDLVVDTLGDIAYYVRMAAGEKPSGFDSTIALMSGYTSMRKFYRHCRQEQRAQEREERRWERAERARIRRLGRS